MRIILGVHAHQPVGNPDEIIEKAFNTCYIPFLETLLEYPNVKMAFHIGGYLLEWAVEKKNFFIELLRDLIKSGRAEILGGGFYEPILSSIPKRDAIGQVRAFSSFLRELFGEEPKGAWVTERVWESCLPEILSEAGIKYAFLDDYHFLCAGFDEDGLNGYFCTEHNGYKLFLFPTSQKLRYYIPFKKVEMVLELLSSIKGVGIIFDDYEKFGLWPETYEWVYDRGWLRSFFKLIQEGVIQSFLPSEYIEKNNPLGLAYLPTASYFEMGEWSLPSSKALQFRELVSFLEEKESFQKYKNFIRGGIWKGFLTKYPESNYMHKKMYLISKLVEDMPEGELKERARKHLYKGQCNDAYWHGIFGGIYFPHLRRSIFKELSKAERLALGERKLKIIEDIDMDGSKEVYLSTQNITCTIKPSLGGSIREISFHPCEHNLVDTLSRRREHYHMLKEIESEKGKDIAQDSIATIHERIYKIEAEELVFDEHERSFGYEEISFDNGKSWINLINERFEIVEDNETAFEVEFKKTFPNLGKIDLKKRIVLLDNGLKIIYLFDGDPSPRLKMLFNIKLTSIESNYALLKFSERSFHLGENLAIQGESFEIEDKISSLKILVSADFPFQAKLSPIYTLSQSENGFDRIYQATEIAISPLEDKNDLTIHVKLTKA